MQTLTITYTCLHSLPHGAGTRAFKMGKQTPVGMGYRGEGAAMRNGVSPGRLLRGGKQPARKGNVHHDTVRVKYKQNQAH